MHDVEDNELFLIKSYHSLLELVSNHGIILMKLIWILCHLPEESTLSLSACREEEGATPSKANVPRIVLLSREHFQ